MQKDNLTSFKQDVDLAIVVPYFKKTFFEETLLSLKNQSNKRFNLYIGNDCSPNDPDDLIQKYRSELRITYHKFKENLGNNDLVKQWERCIFLANQENWILILGDDDVLGSNVVESFYHYYTEFSKQINVVRIASQKIDSEGKTISNIYSYPIWEKSTNILFNDKRSSLSEYIFKRETVNKVRFKNFPLAWFADILAVLEFSKFSKIFSINESVVWVRYSSENISGRRDHISDLLKLKSAYMFYDYLLKYKIENFTNNERKILLQKFSKTYINDKRKFGRFFRIAFFYLKFGHYKDFFYFILDIIKNTRIIIFNRIILFFLIGITN